MSLENRKVIFNGGEISPFWWHDKESKYHNRFGVTLDHTVDVNILKNAWNKTKRVYEVIDWVPDFSEGNLVFYHGDGENDPIKSKTPITPGGSLTKGRAFSVSYFGNHISFNAMHSIVDGGGINYIFSTLMYFYLSEYFDEYDETPPVMIKENRAPEDYYVSLSSVEKKEYDPKPIVASPKKTGRFADSRMTGTEDGFVRTASLRFGAGDYIGACKKIGANPSAMMCVLLSKAAYAVNTETRGDIILDLTMSVRKEFGLSESIANCSANAFIPVSYDEVMCRDISEGVKKIRSLIDYQKDGDYVRTLADFYQTYDWILSSRFGTVTYIGKLDFGKNTKHVVSFDMSDDATDSLYLMELNDDFMMMFQLGMATEDYLNAISELLKEFGVEAKVFDAPHNVPFDSNTVVLD